MKNVKTTFKLFQYPMYCTVQFVKELDSAGFTELADNEQNVTVTIRIDDRQTVYDIIVHEMVHVKQMVEQFIEGELDSESEAYFISVAARLTIDAYDNMNKGTKK